MLRIRITYSKTELMRYTSNLDVHKAWERTFRRAHLPLAYSQGFHPQPKMNQACPLPLGITSSCELIDVWLSEDLPLDRILDDIKNAAPPGFEIHKVDSVDLRLPSLPTQVQSTEFVATLLEPTRVDLDQRMIELLGANSLLRERRGKTYDLRPLIESITIEKADPQDQIRISMRLASREGATGRPEEVLLALGLDPAAARLERIGLFLSQEISNPV